MCCSCCRFHIPLLKLGGSPQEIWRAQLLMFFFSFGVHNCWCFSFHLACTTVGVLLFIWRAQLLVFCFYLGASNSWFSFCCFSLFFLLKIQTTSPHVHVDILAVPELRPSTSGKVTLPASFFSLCSTSGIAWPQNPPCTLAMWVSQFVLVS